MGVSATGAWAWLTLNGVVSSSSSSTWPRRTARYFDGPKTSRCACCEVSCSVQRSTCDSRAFDLGSSKHPWSGRDRWVTGSVFLRTAEGNCISRAFSIRRCRIRVSDDRKWTMSGGAAEKKNTQTCRPKYGYGIAGAFGRNSIPAPWSEGTSWIVYESWFSRAPLRRHDNSWNGRDQIWNGRNQILNGRDQTLNGRNQILNGRDQTLNGRNQILNGRNQILNGRNQTLNGRDQILNGRNQILNGRNQTLNGRDQTLNGRNQILNGRDQTLNGRNQILNGRNQILNGRDQTLNGRNHRRMGEVKSECEYRWNRHDKVNIYTVLSYTYTVLSNI